MPGVPVTEAADDAGRGKIIDFWRRPRYRRRSVLRDKMKQIVWIVVATVLLLAASIGLCIYVICPMTRESRLAWESRVTEESIHILENAQTTDELADAVGSLGAFLAFADGSWVAIRYRDQHTHDIFSSAVARDSRGEWFHTDQHFCGILASYARSLEDQQDAQGAATEELPTNPPKGFEGVHALATSPDLATARENLKALGFRRMEK